MNTSLATSSWRADLPKARNVTDAQRPGFELLLSWFENWLISQRLEPGRELVRAFWVQQVRATPRAAWQMDQWKEALVWYLGWLRYAQVGNVWDKGWSGSLIQAGAGIMLDLHCWRLIHRVRE